MNNLLKFMCSENYSYEVRVIIAHIQLQNIHPFIDGNGRTARVLLDACFEQKLGYRIHPCLYRLAKQDNSYIDAVHAILDDQDEYGINHPFWEKSFLFGENLLKIIKGILHSAKVKLQAKIALYLLQPNTIKLFNYLWEQPIVCDKGLNRYFGWDCKIAQLAIKELVSLNVLEQRQLASPVNAVIYNCPVIFDTWQKIDDELFDDKYLKQQGECNNG